ncbi:unnamed protein product [Prorocentrum cordatum]|nr:unnamed protein product [Polarella glacialis]
MTNLQNFYCTSCMMTSPPKALAGLRSLKSFVAFGQSEFSPCLLKKLSKNMSRCRVTWETKNLFRTDSESPMFSCPEFSYAFPFADSCVWVGPASRSYGWTATSSLEPSLRIFQMSGHHSSP